MINLPKKFYVDTNSILIPDNIFNFLPSGEKIGGWHIKSSIGDFALIVYEGPFKAKCNKCNGDVEEYIVGGNGYLYIATKCKNEAITYFNNIDLNNVPSNLIKTLEEYKEMQFEYELI